MHKRDFIIVLFCGLTTMPLWK